MNVNKVKKIKEASKEEADRHPVFLATRTFGQKAADYLSRWAGSWTFILAFVFFLIAWMLINGYFWFRYSLQGNPFDPYPFILLNLVLSTLAALQAPVILMSQNRASQRDRIRAEYDYSVNRKAEREIRQIQEDIEKIKRAVLKNKGG
jgi:uncharacterized membrane protein